MLIALTCEIMILQDEILEIGKFFKTHGLKGELNAVLDVDDDFLETDSPLIVDMEGIFVPFFPEFMRSKGAEACLVKLKGVDSQEEAQKFVNKTVYARRDDLEDYFGELPLAEDLKIVGYELIDDNSGPVGTIEDLDDSTENILLIVKRPDGTEVYVPFNEDFITMLDHAESKIHMNLPEGLVDLNDKKDE